MVVDSGCYILNGTATLDRLQLQIGLGEWLDIEPIGQLVDVTVSVKTIVTGEQ